MPAKIRDFRKCREYLICIDSDGCVMDTMDTKHKTCFGPCLIEAWGLGPWKDRILCRWNEINLYSATRGINRFLGLAQILEEIDRGITPVEGVADLKAWAEGSRELSNDGVRRAWERTGRSIFEKALRWSEQVNRQIRAMDPKEKRAFAGTREALEKAHAIADVVILSSANRQAVQEEWERQGFLPYTDLVLAQDAGTKAECVRLLLQLGYDPDRVLVIGDAPGDCQAALENQALYYPILVKREPESWNRFTEEASEKLVAGGYRGAYQDQVLKEFWENLET